MAKIKKTHLKCWQECGSNTVNVKQYIYFGKRCAVSNKTKHSTTLDPVIPTLGVYLQEMKIYIHKKTCTRMFITAEFIIAQT